MSGGAAGRLVWLGHLAAALEQGGCDQHERTAGDLERVQHFGEKDRRQRGAGERLDERDNRCPGGGPMERIPSRNKSVGIDARGIRATTPAR
jgi:hypothetical protein